MLTPEQIREIRKRCEKDTNWVENHEGYDVSSAMLHRILINTSALLSHIAEQDAEIAELREECEGYEKACDTRDRMLCEYSQKTDELKVEIARLRETERWIPVEERLPEHRGLVLVFLNWGTCDVTYHIDGEWRRHYGFGRVTHWRPLPLPPEGGANG